ncbi:MAG: hypothetical protein EPN93_20220 [Spirochaetes bacterium]|nr:MAG: hypothetical protein EPN93_20220 [Spirochaetota bacterium]
MKPIASKMIRIAFTAFLAWGCSLPCSAADLVTVASFSTSVEDQDENVRRNIHIACGKLDGIVIGPKSSFNFNDTVGEATAKNGFVNGRVLYRDEVRYEPGGGLCQVSSTLYNALLLAGCAIVERHRHMQPVTYVPLGLDATIKFGKKNLVIKNPYDRKLVIRAEENDKTLTIHIKADSALPHRYEIVTEDEELEVPIVTENRRVRSGVTVQVYRQKYSGNKLIESFLLYKDYYPPVYVK